MNKIQITEANLKQASLIKSLVRLPWLKKIRHLLLTVWGVFCYVCLLVSSIMVLWTFFPYSSWCETSLFYNCESLSKITKLMRLDTNPEEQRQLWQRFQLCSSCCVLCYSLSVRWPTEALQNSSRLVELLFCSWLLLARSRGFFVRRCPRFSPSSIWI